MDDCVEREGTPASTVPKSLYCSYNANFKSVLCKHAGETNGATAWKFPVVEMLEKTMTFTYVGNSTQNVICGSNQGNCNATDKKFLEFVLQKHENGLPVPSETILMQAFKVSVLP
jgi:hypothetical protein